VLVGRGSRHFSSRALPACCVRKDPAVMGAYCTAVVVLRRRAVVVTRRAAAADDGGQVPESMLVKVRAGLINNRYRVTEKIGAGSFGDIFIGAAPHRAPRPARRPPSLSTPAPRLCCGAARGAPLAADGPVSGRQGRVHAARCGGQVCASRRRHRPRRFRSDAPPRPASPRAACVLLRRSQWIPSARSSRTSTVSTRPWALGAAGCVGGGAAVAALAAADR
jgi:hypothetical protein